MGKWDIPIDQILRWEKSLKKSMISVMRIIKNSSNKKSKRQMKGKIRIKSFLMRFSQDRQFEQYAAIGEEIMKKSAVIFKYLSF